MNGQLSDATHAQNVMAEKLDGAMFGRAAYNTPWILTDIDRVFFDGSGFETSRINIVERLINYAEKHQEQDRSTKALIRHVMGLFSGQPGARIWRRTLSEALSRKEKPSVVLTEGLSVMTDFAIAS